MKALFLRHIQVETPALAGEMARQLGIEPIVLDISTETPWPSNLNEISHLVILGGPASVYEKEKNPWLKDEEAFLNKAIKANIPILGICLGAQILAQMLGGKVEAGRNFELGWGTLKINAQGQADPLLLHLNENLAVFHWHGDRFSAPEGSLCLASTPATPCQAFRYRENIWGLQFHIEVRSQDIKAWRQAYPKENKLLPEKFDEQNLNKLKLLKESSKSLLQTFFTLSRSK